MTVDALHTPPTFSSAIVDARNYMAWIVATLRPYLGRNVLEAGIGHGGYYEYFGKLGRYHGVDIDSASIEGARVRYPGGDFEVADICSDEFRSRFSPGSVDTVVGCNVIEHVDDDNRAVANLANALTAGGHLLILVPALQQLYGELDRLAGHHRRYDKPLMLQGVRRRAGRHSRAEVFQSDRRACLVAESVREAPHAR